MRVLTSGGGLGIDDSADAERAVDQRGDGACADVGGYSGTDAIDGMDVVLTCGQGGAFASVADTVAEEDFRGGVGLIQRGEDACRGLLLVEGGDFFPGDSVSPNLEGAESASWGRRLDVGEWFLAQDEALVWRGG